MALPKIILVREEAERDGTTYLVAGKNVQEAMGTEDGPMTIGTYQLVGTRRMAKVPTEIKPGRKK